MYLSKILRQHQFLADEVHVMILTNTDEESSIGNIRSAIPRYSEFFKIEIVAFLDLLHPWILTWAHKTIFREKFSDLSYSHFMYTEDDLEITRRNIDYWQTNREILRDSGLYPSFFRVEWNVELNCWTSTDLTEKINLERIPRLSLLGGTRNYLNSPNPYQGLFFYDRELMSEHLDSPTADINTYGDIEKIFLNEKWGGGVAERANFALTFHNIPMGFTSRTVVPYFEKFGLIDPECWIHHLPNNYANSMPESRNGKVPMAHLVTNDA